MTRATQIEMLLVEDNPRDADSFVAKRVTTEKAFLAELRNHAP